MSDDLNPATPNGDGSSDDGAAAAQSKAEAIKPTVSHVLGEVVWLMTQSPQYKHFALADLEWMVMPPILLNQFRIFRDKTGKPAGAAFWAFLGEDSEKRLEEGPARLRPDEWKSGEQMWLVNLLAPFATAENKMADAMVKDVVDNVCKGRSLKLHRNDLATGKREEVELNG